MLRALDFAFFGFHSLLIAFIVAGWTWRRARPAHLAVTAATGVSWTLFAPWFGWGYCPCTDWHWRVRMALGHTDLPRSYLKLLIDAPTGWDVPAPWVDGVAVVVYAAALVLSIGLNWRDWRARRRLTA